MSLIFFLKTELDRSDAAIDSAVAFAGFLLPSLMAFDDVFISC